MKRFLRIRSGTTLLETLISLSLLGVLITITLSFMTGQMRAFSKASSQTDALQTIRFSLSVLEKDLATVGTNVGPDQPFIVYADSNVFAFNADHTSNIANDAFAVYVDTAALDLFSTSVTKPRRFLIPRSSLFYPDTTYRLGGQNSPAETLIFFFAPDSTTTRTDDYVLMRQVNDQVPEFIGSGLLKQPGLPFFEFWERVTPVSGNPFMQQVALNRLPLRHNNTLHAVPGDTGVLAVIDRLRGVKLNFRVTDNQPGNAQRIFPAARTIWLANAGLSIKQTCGDVPILGNVNFQAQRVVVGGVVGVQLSWTPAVDETGGEKDIIRYVIYRDFAPSVIGDPYLSIPSGNAGYVFTDFEIFPGVPHYYSLAAQDCTPLISGITSAASVTP